MCDNYQNYLGKLFTGGSLIFIADVKRVNRSIDAIVMDRGMASKNNLLKLNGDNLKIIAGIPLTSNEAKKLVARDISEENELMRHQV